MIYSVFAGTGHYTGPVGFDLPASTGIYNGVSGVNHGLVASVGVYPNIVGVQATLDSVIGSYHSQ